MSPSSDLDRSYVLDDIWVSEQVEDKILVQRLADAHLIKVTYPTRPVDLDVHQERLVFNIGGWLLSSALSRVKRQPSLGPDFLPFVNTHKHDSAAEFRRLYPELRDLELVVEERNIQFEGKGLIFPSRIFYLFVRTLEVGYKAVMLNPALLATFLGDLPAEIKRVVSTAVPVKEAWARCVAEVIDPTLGSAGGKGHKKQCNELFNLVVTKFHNCRIFAWTKELTTMKKTLKKRRAEMALRDKLKAGVGDSGVRRAPKTKPSAPKVYTQKQRDWQAQLNKFCGPESWEKMTIKDLRGWIKDCGGTPRTGLSKHELRQMLRSFAPRAGLADDMSLEMLKPATNPPLNWFG